MRTLVDENDLPWEEAWELSCATFGYTNHTLLPEALERWPVALLDYVLPRHLQIIYEINRRFLDEVAARYPGDQGRLRRLSLIEEEPRKQVRMAHLAIVGSHSVNGVSALHTELIQSSLVPDFAQLWPERFNNKTNGVTPRRWLLGANPQLSELISGVIGRGWISQLEQLRAWEPYADDAGFCDDAPRASAIRRILGRCAAVFSEFRPILRPKFQRASVGHSKRTSTVRTSVHRTSKICNANFASGFPLPESATYRRFSSGTKINDFAR